MSKIAKSKGRTPGRTSASESFLLLHLIVCLDWEIASLSIGATVSLVAIVMFGLAWYEYEARVVLEDQVLTGPTHNRVYGQMLDQQQANLGEIDKAMHQVAAENGGNDGEHAEH